MNITFKVRARTIFMSQTCFLNRRWFSVCSDQRCSRGEATPAVHGQADGRGWAQIGGAEGFLQNAADVSFNVSILTPQCCGTVVAKNKIL